MTKRISTGRKEISQKDINELNPNPVKIYTGVFLNGKGTITVEAGDTKYKLKHIVLHSPTGLTWGYTGSGPADTARSILTDSCGIKIADELYQEFKWEFIAGQPDKLSIEDKDIIPWVQKKLTEKLSNLNN